MVEISVVLPCRNEKKAILACIQSINAAFKGQSYEIIVSDSSIDGSDIIAKKAGARVIKHNKVGYGIAIREGIYKAKGRYIVVADADMTYNFAQAPWFVEQLRHGYDFVIGNRFTGNMHKHSMPALHKYVGNPILSFMQRLLFSNTVKDSHCGMRALTKEAFEKMNLKTSGMEFASEMVIKATSKKLRIKQLPISYHPRIGESKLSSFSDGWRHLRFMMLYSPTYLFFIPGLFLFTIGSLFLAYMFPFTNKFVHPMFIASVLVMIGFQLILFGLFAKAFVSYKLHDIDLKLDHFVRRFSLEEGIGLGILMLVVGILIFSLILVEWINTGFGSLNMIKVGIVGLTVFVIGFQTIISSFMFSFLGIE